jgi:hypothetical protein
MVISELKLSVWLSTIVFSLKRPKNKPLTNQWYYNFMSHWTNLKLVKTRVLDAARARAATKTNVELYFDQLNTVLTNFNFTIKPESIYNIDEKGINMNHKPT